MQIIWHSRAKQDLNQNIRYIALQSPKNALMVLDTLTKLADSLKIFPLAHPLETIYNNDNIRFIAKWSFKIIYRIDDDTIYILRIFNTNQHPSRI